MTESGPIELVSDQLAIPTQKGIRLGRGCYFLQRLTPQAVSDLRQRGLVSFRKEQSALDLGFQDTVLRGQIFVPQQQFLIDGAGDVGQHASPNHFCASWLMELRRSWIVGLIEALEKAIRRDSSRLQASPFQTGRIS